MVPMERIISKLDLWYHNYKLIFWKRIPRIRKAIRIGLLFLLLYFIFCLPKNLFVTPYSTVVEDSNGDVLMAHIASDGQWRFPASDSVPAKFATALITFEDKRFYNHWGVSIMSLSRAMIQNLKAKRVVSGGSTLSMQVIRMSRQRTGKSIWDKLKEMVMAVRLETRFSKDEILSLHAAHAPFGGNVVGLEAASWRYFGHSGKQLSWGEASMLAVLPNAPSLMHLSKNRSQLRAKRDRLLKRLFDRGEITELEYQTALEEELPQSPKPLPQMTPHYMAFLSNQGYQGKRYQSTIDKDLQKEVNNIVQRRYQVNSSHGINNACVLVLDVETKDVLAYTGNTPCTEEDKKHVDIIQAPRSTGSILKPFLYALAMQNGELTPNMLLADYPTRINGYAPENYESNYDGLVPTSEALARSLNIPAVRLLSEYGVPRFKSNLEDLGLSTLFRPANEYGLALILGGAEANIWDLGHAYAEMASAASGKGSNNIVSPGVAWEILNAMSSVNRPQIEQYWNRFEGREKIAWKTGTSFGARDAWAIGLTQKYVVAVWVGNATSEGVTGMTGSNTAAPILFDVFQYLPDTTWFEQPTRSMKGIDLCIASGQRATNHCPATQRSWVPSPCLTVNQCPWHKQIYVSRKTGERVFAQCAETGEMQQKVYMVIPAIAEQYYKMNHPEYETLPKFRASCLSGDKDFELTYPLPKSSLQIPRLISGGIGQLVFEAAHRQSGAEIFWYLDDEFLTTTKDVHQVQCQPSKGKHVLSITDASGIRIQRSFWVK